MTDEPTSGVHALQIAVVSALKSSDAVRALIADRIFDEVPSDKERPDTPYVYFGPVNRRRIEGGTCTKSATVTLRIFVVSTEFGRIQAWSVIEAIELALDNLDLTLTGPWSTGGDVLRAIQDGDVIAPLDPKSAFADFTTTLISLGV